MKNLLTLIIAAIATMVPIMAAAEEKDLLEAEEAYKQAKLQNDLGALRKILADDFDGVNQWGTRRDKASLIDLFSEFKINAISISDAKVRIFGTIAIVDGLMKESGPGGSFPNLVFSRVWIKRDGRWQLLSSIQMTPMDQP